MVSGSWTEKWGIPWLKGLFLSPSPKELQNILFFLHKLLQNLPHKWTNAASLENPIVCGWDYHMLTLVEEISLTSSGYNLLTKLPAIDNMLLYFVSCGKQVNTAHPPPLPKKYTKTLTPVKFLRFCFIVFLNQIPHSLVWCDFSSFICFFFSFFFHRPLIVIGGKPLPGAPSTSNPTPARYA